jgi:hypothetical protein
MKSPSEANGEEFQRLPQGEFRAPAARKSDDTTEKVQPAGVARAQLFRPSNASFWFPSFRSKIDLHPLS